MFVGPCTFYLRQEDRWFGWFTCLKKKSNGYIIINSGVREGKLYNKGNRAYKKKKRSIIVYEKGVCTLYTGDLRRENVLLVA